MEVISGGFAGHWPGAALIRLSAVLIDDSRTGRIRTDLPSVVTRTTACSATRRSMRDDQLR